MPEFSCIRSIHHDVIVLTMLGDGMARLRLPACVYRSKSLSKSMGWRETRCLNG